MVVAQILKTMICQESEQFVLLKFCVFHREWRVCAQNKQLEQEIEPPLITVAFASASFLFTMR